MRISDWSSDVCSSDLQSATGPNRRIEGRVMQGASPAAGAPMGILRCQRGSVTVEGALVAVLLGVLLLGVIDFGLAFRRQSELANAVRAGTQFALVRRPQQDRKSVV